MFDLIQSNKDIIIFLEQADKNFKALGYTEQGIMHARFTSKQVGYILSTLMFSEEDIDIGMTAGFLHDIGCCVAYKGHTQSGSFIVNKVLSKLGIKDDKKIKILTIIGSHEETDLDMFPISEISAAVTIADKTDVRRERVIKTDLKFFDQFDRVHYAVVENNLNIDIDNRLIKLSITIDDTICSVLEYFELFMSRIQFCKKAAGKLGLRFELYINKVKYL
ncbi:MAG: HD domain-containing protein [Endomicrobia bacterium]|nr:HD domain-containing protein [Endomicrobiia bacterium]